MTALASAGCLLIMVMAAVKVQPAGLTQLAADGSSTNAAGNVSPMLTTLAADRPEKQVTVIVQLAPGTGIAKGEQLVARDGGQAMGELHIINGLAARMTAAQAARLGTEPSVRYISLNAPVKRNALSSIDTTQLVSSYPDSLRAPKAWSTATGAGVGVAVVDTGIAGTLPDFRTSQTDSTSRVVATVATNPYATSDNDSYGHGTHVAGIIAGDSNNRPSTDPLHGGYIGVAPDANLISVKIADEKGDATVLDAIYGLQFAVDNKDTYNIRVVNLSFESTLAQSYKTDPLDAAAESAWLHGIVVVAAAGNRGASSDAVNYAPGNDPYVISVGGVDDQGTKNTLDDSVADWSSHGTTQDGYAKPDVLAPGAHIVSLLAPNSAFASMCPSCVVSGQYIRAGGTSMAAPMVSGAVADLLQVHPGYTPNQVKGVVTSAVRKIDSASPGEAAIDTMLWQAPTAANQGLTPNIQVSSSTGNIDYTRSSWSRSSWSRSSWSRSSWSRSSWSCACSKTLSGVIDPTRSSWSRSSWSTSWTK